MIPHRSAPGSPSKASELDFMMLTICRKPQDPQYRPKLRPELANLSRSGWRANGIQKRKARWRNRAATLIPPPP